MKSELLGEQRVGKTVFNGNLEVCCDENRLASMIFAYVNPQSGLECSIKGLREMINSLKFKFPDSWKDELIQIISSVPGANSSFYSSLIYGKDQIRSNPDLFMPDLPEDCLNFLYENLENPGILSKIQKFFISTSPSSALFSSFSKSPELFQRTLSLLYIFNQTQLFSVFQDFLESQVSNKIEQIVEFLDKYEEGLKAVPSGKLLHLVYCKLAKVLSGNQGSKALADYFHCLLIENQLPRHFSTLYILCSEKDIFESFHLELCIQRTLLAADDAVEKQLCEKIQEKAGPEALKSVFSILKSKKEYQVFYEKMNVLIVSQKFMKNSQFSMKNSLEFDVNRFPEPLLRMVQGYEQVFKESFPKKTLAFHYLTGIIELNYGKCELVCNFVQGVIFLLFNDRRVLGKSEICDLIGCTEGLKSIVLSEIENLRSVLKEELGGFSLNFPDNQNFDFTKKTNKNLANEEKNEKFEESSKIRIDCFIVKLLKHEKQIDIDILIDKLEASLRFSPSSSLIEERFKSLEEKGFIWRVEKYKLFSSCGYIP